MSQRKFDDVVEAMFKVLPSDDAVALEIKNIQRKMVWDAPEVLWHKYGRHMQEVMTREWGDPLTLSVDRIDALHIWSGS